MKTGQTSLQLARILVLLFLLRATEWYVEGIEKARVTLQLGDVWAPWAAVSLVSVLSVAVMLAGRHTWHPWVVLAVEAVVAAVLAFVPPLQWVHWLGTIAGGLPRALLNGFVQPLSVAWLGVVVLRAFHQWRDSKAVSPRPSGDSTRTDSDSAESPCVPAP